MSGPSSPFIEVVKPIPGGLNISWRTDVNSKQEKYVVIYTRNDTDRSVFFKIIRFDDCNKPATTSYSARSVPVPVCLYSTVCACRYRYRVLIQNFYVCVYSVVDPDPHGSAWIRIDLALLNPDPGARKPIKIYKYCIPELQPVKNAFVPM